MFGAIKKNLSLYLIAVTVMTASFMFNLFGVQSLGWFNNFQTDSEALIVHKLACFDELGKDEFGGMLLAGKDPANFAVGKQAPVCQKDKSTEYVSQFGLQGKIAHVLYAVLDFFLPLRLSHFLGLMQFLWALFTAGVLGAFVVWVKQRYGRFVAVTAMILLSLSVWIIGYARNLYWATPFFFLPLVYTLFYYTPPKNQKPYYLFLGGLFILFFLRFLNGFEFAPEVILSVVTVMSYLTYKQANSFKRLIKEGIVVCLVGLMAFLGAFAANYAQVYRYVGDSTAARKMIMQRVLDRTSDSAAYSKYVYDGFYNTVPAGYAMVNNYIDLKSAQERKPFVTTNVVSTINYALLPVVGLPVMLNETLAMFVSSFAFFVLLAFVAVNRLGKKGDSIATDEKLALRRALWIGLLSSLSWLVLAHSHSFVHAHLTGIVYYLPFLLFAYIVLALWLEKAYGPVRAALLNARTVSAEPTRAKKSKR